MADQWDAIMAQLDDSTAVPHAPSTSDVWQKKYKELDIRMKEMQAEHVAEKNKLLQRFKDVVNAVKDERRMHEEDLAATRQRAEEAESRAEEYETNFLQAARLMEEMKDKQSIELSKAKAAGGGNAQQAQALKEALAQASEQTDRAYVAEQRVLTLQGELESEINARSTAETSLEAVKAKFLQLGEISKNLKNENAELNAKVQALESSQKSSNSSVQELSQLKAENETLRTKTASSVEEVTNLKKKIIDTEAKVKSLENDLGTAMAKLKAQTTSATTSGQASSQQIAQLEAELKETKSQRDKALAEHKLVDDKFNSLLPKISADRDRSKTEIAALTEIKAKLESDVSDLQTKLKSSEAAAKLNKTKLEDALAAAKAPAPSNNAQVELDKNKQLITKLRDELNASKGYVSALEEKLNKATAALSAARDSAASGADPTAFERLKTENSSLRDRLSAADSKATQLKREVAELRDELSRGGTGTSSVPTPAAPIMADVDVSGGGGPPPPPPPPAGGPPPPPPPPPAGKKTGGPLKIERSAKSTAALQASSSNNSSSSSGDSQSALIDAINKGVRLKKTDGPENVEDKLKRLESQKKEKGATGPTGASPLADFASLGMMAKQLALKRTARVEAKEQGSGRSRNDAARQSVSLNNLLKDI